MSGRALIYQVLDDILAGTAVLPRARRTIFTVVDHLRLCHGNTGNLLRAENVSIQLHKLEWSVQRCDDKATERAREALKRIAVEMLDLRIRTSVKVGDVPDASANRQCTGH